MRFKEYTVSISPQPFHPQIILHFYLDMADVFTILESFHTFRVCHAVFRDSLS